MREITFKQLMISDLQKIKDWRFAVNQMTEEVTSWCVQSPCKDETPSNADRIRGMNDEELAKFMGELPCCPPGADAKELCYPMDACEGTDLQVQCWLDWLKEEVTANDS